MSEEIRTTSSTGGQKGVKDIRLGGADPLAMLELGRVYGFGEAKYDRFNYLKGYEFSKSIDALKRHLLAFEAREDRDPESGLLHTAHVTWHGLALTSFLLRDIAREHPEFDDRPPATARFIEPSLASYGAYACPHCGLATGSRERLHLHLSLTHSRSAK